MTDLNRLRVSLTKHNAHKVARLLKDHPAAEVFDRLSQVSAEKAQARKNLSTSGGDILPSVWQNGRALGDDAIDALVLVAIIFSHHALIEAMVGASERHGLTGRVVRGGHLKGKEYTNFARIIDQLGFATNLEYEGVSFNLNKMFEINGLGPLVLDLLELKLIEAGWGQSNSATDEIVRLELNKVFGLPAVQLSAWLIDGMRPAASLSEFSAKDQQFFQDETEGPAPKEFKFKAGHERRDVEPITRSASPRSRANRLHNDIQNRLYDHLKEKFGAKNVGTEIDTGVGTSIDLATRVDDIISFYEIKTGSSVRSNIRQALPQLLEYNYWPYGERASRLIIVSHLPLTTEAARYLQHLMVRFKLPISYQQFDLKRNVLRQSSPKRRTRAGPRPRTR